MNSSAPRSRGRTASSATPRPSLPGNRRSFLKLSAFAAAAVAGSPLLAACGSDEPAADDQGGGGELGSATFLSPIPLETLSLSPELFAVAGGHFKKHGLDVTLQPAKGTSQALQTLLSGIAPVSRIGQVDVMKAIVESDQPLVAVGTPLRSSVLRFVYSKKNYAVEKPEDLVGQTMGVPSEGGTADKSISLVLASAGIDPSKTKRQVVGLTPGTFSLVKQGRLAGYVVSIDTANILRSQDPDAGVFDPSEFITSDSQVYVTTKSTLEKEPDKIKAFLAGIRDGLAAMDADPDFSEALKQLRSQYSFKTLNDDGIATASLSMLQQSWTGDGSQPLLVTDERTWSQGYQELTKVGLVKPGGDPASWLDNSLLPTS